MTTQEKIESIIVLRDIIDSPEIDNKTKLVAKEKLEKIIKLF